MKKYWNKLTFASVAFLSLGMTACGDDKESVPAYYYGNYAYIYYQLYPDTDEVPALEATHDARGISTSGFFRDFRIRLKKPVKSDTRITLGVDDSAVNPETEHLMPESALKFLAMNPETGEKTEEIIIPAGATETTVNVLLENTEFATASKDATNYTAPIRITDIESENELKISKNRNRVIYTLSVSAYQPNSVTMTLASGENETTIKGAGADDLLYEYFGDMTIRLGYPSTQDTKVTFEPDYSLNGEEYQELPLSALRFTVDGTPIAGSTVVIPAGASSITVRTQLADASFMSNDGGEYQCPIKITQIEGDEIEYEGVNFFFRIKQASLEFTAPTVGHLDENRNYTITAADPNHPITNPTDRLTDNDYYSFCYAPSKVLDFAVDFGTEQEIVGIRFEDYMNWGSYSVRNLNIYTSADGMSWTLLYEVAEDIPQGSPQDISFPTITTRYLRLECTKGWNAAGPYISEFYTYMK